MTLHIGQQIIAVHILPNISWSKDNQVMRFGQLIEYYIKIFFLKYHAENKTERLVPDLFFFFKEALFKVKTSGQYFSFNIFW